MRVCGLLGAKSEKRFYRRCPNSKPQQNPPKRSFHLIFRAGNSAFLRLPLFFPSHGTVKVSGSYIDRLTKAQMGQFQALKIQGGSAPFFRTAPAEWPGRFSASPLSHSPPLILYQLGKNKITLSSNSAKISSFQQPTRKDE